MKLKLKIQIVVAAFLLLCFLIYPKQLTKVGFVKLKELQPYIEALVIADRTYKTQLSEMDSYLLAVDKQLKGSKGRAICPLYPKEKEIKHEPWCRIFSSYNIGSFIFNECSYLSLQSQKICNCCSYFYSHYNFDTHFNLHNLCV